MRSWEAVVYSRGKARHMVPTQDGPACLPTHVRLISISTCTCFLADFLDG